jgi:ABC-type dipeptide/oligopeptide/nickel transport system permease component
MDSNDRNNTVSGNKPFRVIVLSVVKSIALLVLGALVLRFAILELGGFGSYGDDITELKSIFTGDIFSYATFKWGFHFSNLAMTSIIVFLALTWSSVISVSLGYQLAQRPHARYWNAFAGLFTLSSGLPLFAVGLLAYLQFADFGLFSPLGDGFWNTPAKLLCAALILGSCEGALGEWPRTFRAIFADLQEQTYYQACRARGQSTLGLVYRTTKPLFLQSLATRISYLFGAVIIVEKALELQYLGHNFISSMLDHSRLSGYCEAMISGLLIMMIPIAARMILNILQRNRTETATLDTISA